MALRHFKTTEKTMMLNEYGYAVIYKKECQNRKEISRQDARPPPSMNHEQVKNYVQSDSFFGIVKCSFKKPSDELRAKMNDFPPIFHRGELDLSHASDAMKDIIEELGKTKAYSKPRTCLLQSSWLEESCIYIKELLDFYLSIGMEIDQIDYIGGYIAHSLSYRLSTHCASLS